MPTQDIVMKQYDGTQYIDLYPKTDENGWHYWVKFQYSSEQSDVFGNFQQMTICNIRTSSTMDISYSTSPDGPFLRQTINYNTATSTLESYIQDKYWYRGNGTNPDKLYSPKDAIVSRDGTSSMVIFQTNKAAVYCGKVNSLSYSQIVKSKDINQYPIDGDGYVYYYLGQSLNYANWETKILSSSYQQITIPLPFKAKMCFVGFPDTQYQSNIITPSGYYDTTKYNTMTGFPHLQQHSYNILTQNRTVLVLAPSTSQYSREYTIKAFPEIG